MTTFSFEIQESEASKLKAVLKAFGVRKLKIKEENKLSKEDFENKLIKAKAGSGTKLNTKEDVSNFFNSI